MPREHFEADEKPHLLPAPTVPYDIPLWCDPKVGADQHAQVARALYGAAIGEFAQKLFEASPLPWTRMRQLGMLQGLIKRFGPRRVDETCAMAVAADMILSGSSAPAGIHGSVSRTAALPRWA